MKKIIFILITISFALFSSAQKKQKTTANDDDSILLSKTKYRLVGPFAVAEAERFAEIIKIKTPFISEAQAVVFGKHRMEAATGKIFLINFLEAL